MKNQKINCTVWILIILGYIFLFQTNVDAATFTVDDSGSGDYYTIGDAVSAASSGDTIQVYPGNYQENVTLKAGIMLFGSGPDRTVIDGGASSGIHQPAVTMAEGSLISGFKVTNGWVGISSRDCTSVIMNNVVTGNYHMGISLIADAPNSAVHSRVINNTVADNLGATSGSPSFGIYTEPQGPGTVADPTIMNNIITGHTFGISPYMTTPIMSYNDVWGNTTNYGYGAAPGLNDISENPLFADSQYHLSATSPCIDAGNPAPQYTDPDGTRNDMGAYGGVTDVGPLAGSHTGNGFLFTSIGKIPTSEIIQDEADRSYGLADVSPKVAAFYRIPAYKDSPFGGDLWLHGWFGEDDPVSYYQILVGKWVDDNPPAMQDYVPLSDPLSKVKYTVNPDGSITHQYVNLGPKKIAGIENLYQLTDEGFWSHIDLRMIWNTRLWPNGKYSLIYRAYRVKSFFPLALELVNLKPNDLDHITIIIDNSPVTAIIHNVKYDPSSPHYTSYNDGVIPECGMIYLSDPSENLRFTITAWHPNGYLKSFVLDSLYGKNRYGGVIKSASYVPTIFTAPYWHGVQETEYNSADAPRLKPWTRCAYQFRLRVTSRTTDGFNYIIGSTFNDHYFLEFKTCPGDIDNDGDVDGDDLSILSLDYGSTVCQ